MPIPSVREREDYLLLFVFGATPTSPLARCVRRAYRDFNRTLHGMREHLKRERLNKLARDPLERSLQEVLASTSMGSQSAFDSWRQGLVEELCALYAREDFASFGVGHAQKWINMSFKYAVIFGEDRIPGTSRLFSWLHVPIDNVILRESNRVPPPRMPEIERRPWSGVTDYANYLALQQWIRDAFPNETPPAVEFRLWRDGVSKLAKHPADPRTPTPFRHRRKQE